mgnify:CR=1 FL=1
MEASYLGSPLWVGATPALDGGPACEVMLVRADDPHSRPWRGWIQRGSGTHSHLSSARGLASVFAGPDPGGATT